MLDPSDYWLNSPSFLRVAKQREIDKELETLIPSVVSGGLDLKGYCDLSLLARKAYESALLQFRRSNASWRCARWSSIHALRIAINCIRTSP